MTPGLDFYNAGRSWRRALREYEQRLAAIDEAENRFCKARYELITALENAEKVGVFGDEGRGPRTAMRQVLEQVKGAEFTSMWKVLQDARLLLELFGMRRGR